MINPNSREVSNKVLLSGMAFSLIVGITVMGIWFFWGKVGGGKTGTVYKPLTEKNIPVAEKMMNEIESMSLLELINLRDKMIKFRERGKMDFEIDVSGFLEVFE